MLRRTFAQNPARTSTVNGPLKPLTYPRRALYGYVAAVPPWDAVGGRHMVSGRGLLFPSCVLRAASRRNIPRPSGPPEEPIYDDVTTWPKEWEEDDIQDLLEEHIPTGVQPDWQLLTLCFKHDASDSDSVSQVLVDRWLYPGADCTIDELLVSSPRFELKNLVPPRGAKVAARDMEGFAKFFAGNLSVATLVGATMSATRAMVLRSAPGKTFTTLALTGALREMAGDSADHFPIALYLGFGAGNALTAYEEKRIAKGERELGRVLGRRLLLQLHHLSLPDVAATMEDAVETLWNATTTVQMMPVPPLGWDSCDHHLSSRVNFHDVFDRAYALLDVIAGKVGKPIALIPIVDDGQVLDTLIDRDGVRFGARCALNLLRELQYKVSARNMWRAGYEHVVLGIMTGSDPEVSACPQTTGINVSYSSALHETAGFAAIADELVDRSELKCEWAHCADSMVALRKRRLVATFFPHVRELESFVNGDRQALSSLRLARDSLDSELYRDEVYDLMMATALQCHMTTKRNVAVPAVVAVGDDVSSLSTFMPVMGAHMMIRAAEDFLGCPECPVDLVEHCTNVTSADFGRVTPFCLSVVMTLLNYRYANTTMRPRFLPRDIMYKYNLNMAPDVFEWLTVEGDSPTGVHVKSVVQLQNSTGS